MREDVAAPGPGPAGPGPSIGQVGSGGVLPRPENLLGITGFCGRFMVIYWNVLEISLEFLEQ